MFYRRLLIWLLSFLNDLLLNDLQHCLLQLHMQTQSSWLRTKRYCNYIKEGRAVICSYSGKRLINSDVDTFSLHCLCKLPNTCNYLQHYIPVTISYFNRVRNGNGANIYCLFTKKGLSTCLIITVDVQNWNASVSFLGIF